MNAPNVHQLPRPHLPQAQLEAQVVGGALNLGINISEFEALGVAGEDFSVVLFAKAWKIARKRAERREPVSAETVGSAGLKGTWFTPGDCEELQKLADSSGLKLDAFRLLAADLRLMVLKQRYIASLEAEVRDARQGSWSLGRSVGTLEGLAQRLLRDSAPDEDASGDVVELMNAWANTEVTKKSRLLPTRIAVLDAELGGLAPGLTVIAASGGVGKTAVLDSMIRAQLEADPELHLGFFGLEDGTMHIAKRWMAHATGMLLRDVTNVERTPDQHAASVAAAARFKPLLERLHVYRHDTISAPELIARAAAMRAKYGVGGIYVDNLTEVDVSSGRPFGDKEHQALAEFGRRLRNFALREEIPAVLLAHIVGTVRPGEIPTHHDIAGGQALGKRTRLFLGLWVKGDEIRCTTGKANENEAGTTVSFARFKTAGLIDPANGAKINLQQERAIEKRTAAKQRLVDSVITQQERSAMLAAIKAEKVKAEKPAEPPAQQTLLDVPEAPRAE